jgi:hypothetical protein
VKTAKLVDQQAERVSGGLRRPVVGVDDVDMMRAAVPTARAVDSASTKADQIVFDTSILRKTINRLVAVWRYPSRSGA